jgi:hypothetical protein
VEEKAKEETGMKQADLLSACSLAMLFRHVTSLPLDNMALHPRELLIFTAVLRNSNPTYVHTVHEVLSVNRSAQTWRPDEILRLYPEQLTHREFVVKKFFIRIQ